MSFDALAPPKEVKAEVVNGDAIVPATARQGMQLAIQQGNVDALLKFFELQERIDAREARKAFDVAFASFKSEAPKLIKSKAVSFGSGQAATAYKYTPLDEIAEAVGPVLAKHGLSYNWEQAQLNDGVIAIVCILRHTQGHSIQNTLSAKADPSGSKNAIQAIGSAVTYLRRYTLLGVLGMATGDEDNDGDMEMERGPDFLALIKEASSLADLEKNSKEALAAAYKAKAPTAAKIFMEARQKREAELRK